MSQGKKPQGSTVLLTTGGTIAGWAAQADAQTHYQAGALAGQALLAGLPPAVAHLPVLVDDFARINSKDADSRFWWQLYQRLQAHLADDAVAAVVITHGTDTLEETAFFLSEVLPLPLAKSVVLVAAMRPASHPQADGPQNLADALQLAALQPGVEVHLSGCARSCAAAHTAPVTLLAVSPGHYDVYFRDAAQPGFGRLHARTLSIEAACALLRARSRSNTDD